MNSEISSYHQQQFKRSVVLSKNNMYIGIDPGVKGALAVVDNKGVLVECRAFPTMKEKSAKGRNISRTDLKKMKMLFNEISSKYKIAQISVEKPILMPGQNVASTFNNGKSHGIVLTMIELFFPRSKQITIACKDWQDYLITERTHVESKHRRDKRKQLKKDSIEVAKKVFSGFDFRKASNSKVDSDGMTDAALIAYYTYLMHI